MQDINRRNLMRDARSEEINAEEIARRMKERYGYSKKARKKFIEGLDQIPATMIMPSMYDLKLWICEVKVRLLVSMVLHSIYRNRLLVPITDTHILRKVNTERRYTL